MTEKEFEELREKVLRDKRHVNKQVVDIEGNRILFTALNEAMKDLEITFNLIGVDLFLRDDLAESNKVLVTTIKNLYIQHVNRICNNLGATLPVVMVDDFFNQFFIIKEC